MTDMDYLTVKQVAELRGCSERYIRTLISQNRIEHEEDADPDNHIRQWLIPISALDPKLQAKYYGKQPKKQQPKPEAEKKPLDAYSVEERREIDTWIMIIKEWLSARYGEDKPAVDAKFISRMAKDHPELQLSSGILYRHWKAWRDQDYDALIDKRGKARKGRTSIDETVWQAFLSYYLDESQFPIERCCEYTRLWVKQSRPELLDGIPSYFSFYRRAQNDIPEPVKILGRQGEKAYRDRCAPYIRREYEGMESNEYWVADNHTFDVITEGAGGQRHRLYLTAYSDALSGIFTGFSVVENPSSDATLYALRKGILAHGIPKNLYVDNGREFLTHDVGGLGHRRKKSSGEIIEPPGVFKRLGITMINALVRNARAKIIERRFLDVKNEISRLFETFTGGSVAEKPERLKSVLKAGRIPTDRQLLDAIEDLLIGYYNEQPYNGPIERFRGMSRMDVYLENLHTKRTATEEDLALMLMRSTRPQKVSRRGVHLEIAGRRLDYWDNDLITTYFGNSVYVRYDPENLKEVRVYDTEDRYIKTVAADDLTIQRYGADKEAVKAAQRRIRSAEKTVKLAKESAILASVDRITALDLILQDAGEKRAARIAAAEGDAPVLEIQRVEEQPLLQAVGDIPLDTMVRNAERRFNKPKDEQ